jgi:hypothetical protein
VAEYMNWGTENTEFGTEFGTGEPDYR